MKQIISLKEARERALKILEESENQEKKTRMRDSFENPYREELWEEFQDRQSAINFRVISSIYEAILILLTGTLIYIHFLE